MGIQFKTWFLYIICLGLCSVLKAQETTISINLNEESQLKGGSLIKGLDKYFIELIGFKDATDTLYSISTDDERLMNILNSSPIKANLKNDTINFDITSLVASGANVLPIKINYLGDGDSPAYFDGQKFVEFTIEVTNEDQVTQLTPGANSCVFYSSSMIIETKIYVNDQDLKPFYVFVYDFGALNQGPKVWLYKGESSKVKNHVWVGRNASFSFRNFDEGFDDIKHSISYKDYNLEDAELFSGFLSKEKGASPSTTTSEGEAQAGKDDPLQPLDFVRSNNLKELNIQISNLISDSEKNLIPLNQYRPLLKYVKVNIEKCFSIGIENTNEFVALFKDKNDKEIAKGLSYKLSVLENTIASKHPPFKIKDHDALISKMEYFKQEKKVFESYTDSEIEIPILGGLKVDFSTGLVGSNLVDKSFVSLNSDPRIDTIRISDDEIRVDTVGMKKLIQENSEKFQVGFGVFAHFYPRLTPYLNLAITTGFIIRDNLAFQFPVGLSALIGRQSRIVISGGLTFGQMNVLSAKYQEGVPVEASEIVNLSDNQFTVSQTNMGVFLGLSYNFAKIRTTR
jgi:hypothetical protein